MRSADGERVRISFPGSDASAEPEGERRMNGATFYYVGPSTEWHANENFERIRYRRIYPGIDLVFVTNHNELEYNFEVAAGADPSVIRIRYGDLMPRLTSDGDLEIGKGNLNIIQRRPQVVAGRTNYSPNVPCRYRVRGREVFIELASYDRTLPLVIDPVLVVSTYLGGPGFDVVYGATTDTSGNLYVTGETSSGSLTNPAIPVRSTIDVFVAKLNPSATQLIYLVYLGGSSDDSGRSIAVDTTGHAYVTGVTSSPNFPVTTGVLLAALPGTQNAFVAKLTPQGSLQYSTYLGASGPDFGLAIAVDATGAAYVTGQTESQAFPTTPGAIQTLNAGGLSDCFVSKLNATASSLEYSTMLGGSGLDLCSGIAVDSSGAAYVTGTTYSTNFPLQAALQSGLQGTANVFAAKISPTGSALVYSTYVGGSSIDYGEAITVDGSGNAYVAGTTSSFDFPVTAGAFQGQLSGLSNAFAFKISPQGSSLIYATFLGGANVDVGTSIAVDTTGRTILAGHTNSSNFPIAQAYQTAIAGSNDAFASVLDPTGEILEFSTYLGGSGDDQAYAVVALPGSTLFLAGMTASTNFPTASALQAALSGGYDGFLSELYYGSPGPPEPVSVSPDSGAGLSQTFTFLYADSAGGSDIKAAGIVINSTFSDLNGCFLYYSAGGANLLYLLSNAGALGSGMTVGSSGTLSNSQCSVNVGASSAVLAGNALRLNLALTFADGFAGLKNIYMYAQNATSNSGWIEDGMWTVPGSASACSIAIDRGGTWYVDSNHDFQYDAGDNSYTFGVGLGGALPAVGPWHTPKPSWLGVYLNGTWYVDTEGTGAYAAGDATYSFGFAGAYPVVGDWTHSGVLRIGAFLNGVWYVDTNNDHVFDTGDQTLSYGITGDYPVLGDWGNTGTRKIGVYRGNGVWVVDANADNVFDAGDQYFFFGFTGAIPVVGDWTGNGEDKIGVFDPTHGNWYLDLNGNGNYDPGEGPFQFGQAGDLPAVICPNIN